MGNSLSGSATARTQEQEDVKFLGERCPFGDAELYGLYRAYQTIYNDGNSVHESFLTDWAVERYDQQTRPKGKEPEEDAAQIQARREKRRAVLQIVEEHILGPKFGNFLYKAAFLVEGDVNVYEQDQNSTSQASLVDDFTRKGRLERFFDGVSNSTRRGAHASLKVLFETCRVQEDNQHPSVKAFDFVEMGYRLALAMEFLRETDRQVSEDREAYMPPPNINADPTLHAFSKSIIEQRDTRRRRQNPFAAPTSVNKESRIELEDIKEWSDSVAPLFASILPTFFQYVFFPAKRDRPTGTLFEFPRISEPSAFFETPNSPLLFNFGCLSAALTGLYYRLYTSDDDGLSFNRLQNALLGYSGPTLIVIRAVGSQNSIFGAFTASPWKESKDFYGDTDCFLYQMAPRTSVYRPTGNARNFMYCNSHARSRGYDQQSHGIGFGGSVDQPRLFLAESSLEDHSIAGSRDMTFSHGSLLPPVSEDDASGSNLQSHFELLSLEVWGVGGSEVVTAALGERKKARQVKQEAINRSRKVDKAQFLDDLRSGVIESKAFAHRQQVDGRADPEQLQR